VGTKGTVKGVGSDPWSTEPIYYVDWDNNRFLNLIGDTDMWYKEDEKESLTESTSKYTNPCDTFSEGKEFCKKLSAILHKGRGGTGSRTLKKKMIDFFTELLQGDYTGVGNKVTLEPGNRHFVDRYEELINLQALLEEYGACSKMRKSIENDLEVITTKGLKMVVDDEENYSLLNRIDTHYTFRSYILTKAALDIYGELEPEKSLDDLDNQGIITLINRIAFSFDFDKSFDQASLQFIDSLIQSSLEDENERNILLSSLAGTRSGGNRLKMKLRDYLR